MSEWVGIYTGRFDWPSRAEWSLSPRLFSWAYRAWSFGRNKSFFQLLRFSHHNGEAYRRSHCCHCNACCGWGVPAWEFWGWRCSASVCLAAGAAVLNEVCATRAGGRPNLSGFPPARLEFLVSLSDGQDATQQSEKEAKIFKRCFSKLAVIVANGRHFLHKAPLRVYFRRDPSIRTLFHVYIKYFIISMKYISFLHVNHVHPQAERTLYTDSKHTPPPDG